MKNLVQFLIPVVMTISAVASEFEIRVGEPFPSVVLPAVEDGTAMSIEDFRGQRLMLHVFASW